MNPNDKNPADPVELDGPEQILPIDEETVEVEAERPPAPHHCANHPETESLSECAVCRTPICATCAFTFPGDISYCPECVQSPAVNQIDPKRTRNIRWALGLGVYAVIGSFATIILGSFIEEEQMLDLIGGLFFIFVMVPNIIGFLLAVTTREKRLADPGGTKPAIWLNASCLALFLLLILVGIFMPA